MAASRSHLWRSPATLRAIFPVPRESRRPRARLELRPTVRDLSGELWARWRPSTHGSRLRAALSAMSLAGVRLPTGEEWRPVIVRQLPDVRNPDSRAIIEIALPDMSDRGPRIAGIRTGPKGAAFATPA